MTVSKNACSLGVNERIQINALEAAKKFLPAKTVCKKNYPEVGSGFDEARTNKNRSRVGLAWAKKWSLRF